MFPESPASWMQQDFVSACLGRFYFGGCGWCLLSGALGLLFFFALVVGACLLVLWDFCLHWGVFPFGGCGWFCLLEPQLDVM